MNIYLVRPNYHSHLITPPLGLGYLSSYLKRAGYHVKIIDGLNLGCNNDTLVDICKDADIVGISCLSDYFLEIIDLSRKLKNTKKTVIIGGPHASVLPDLTLSETDADFVIVGEGEQTLLELVQCLNNNVQITGIPGVYHRGVKRFIEREFIDNLDDLPFPDWEQLDPRTYKKAPHGGLIKYFPVAPIITTRGCPYECTFCASPRLWKRTIRFRSAQNIIAEIQLLVNIFGVKEIHFEDDNLTLKRSHVENICHLLIEQGLNVSWATPNGIRADKVTPELLNLMKKSGCYSVAFGIESGNQQILNNVKKKTHLKTIEYAIKEAGKLGLVTQGFFIFGLPGETKESINETVEFAKKTNLDKAQFLFLDVLPGSELWDKLEGTFDVNWRRRSYQDVTWVPNTIDKYSLKNAQAKAFRIFFLRPKPILYFLRYFRPTQLIYVMKRFLDFGVLPVRIKKRKKG